MNMNTQLTEEQLDGVLRRLFLEHQGQAKAIKRWDLVVKVFGEGSDIPRSDDNLQDRSIRSAVERLRRHGVLILDFNDGRGRFLCKDEEEYWNFRSRYLKPLKARANTIKVLDKAAQQKFPSLLQPSLFDLSEVERVLE